MTQITGLAASPNQTFSANDPNGGGPINMALHFRPRTQEWYIDIAFDSFVLNGLKLNRGANILSQYANNIPFGLMVITSDNLDPFLVNDMTSGRVSLLLLTSADVAMIQAAIMAGTILG